MSFPHFYGRLWDFFGASVRHGTQLDGLVAALTAKSVGVRVVARYDCSHRERDVFDIYLTSGHGSPTKDKQQKYLGTAYRDDDGKLFFNEEG